MDLVVIIIIVVVVTSLLLCVGCCYILVFRVFVLDRRKALRSNVRIHYIAPKVKNIVHEFEDEEESKGKPSKRKRQKLAMKKLATSHQLEYKDNLTQLGDIEANDNHDCEAIQPKEVSNKSGENFFSWLSSKFSSKNGSMTRSVSINNASTRENNNENKNASNKMSSKSMASESDDSGSRKQRFISADRLLRAEKRKALIKPETIIQEIVPEEEEEIINDPIPSLLDIEPIRKQRVKSVLAERADSRVVVKQQYRDHGWEDVVQRNAGPPISFIPNGYKLNEMIGSAVLSPEFLIYKRVLYLWEMDGKAEGWYIGTIVSTSKAKGFNFNIKYDREETKNIFVDGVQKVNLQLHGDTAYGRRWVALIRTAPGKFSKAI